MQLEFGFSHFLGTHILEGLRNLPPNYLCHEQIQVWTHSPFTEGFQQAACFLLHYWWSDSNTRGRLALLKPEPAVVNPGSFSHERLAWRSWRGISGPFQDRHGHSHISTQKLDWRKPVWVQLKYSPFPSIQSLLSHSNGWNTSAVHAAASNVAVWVCSFQLVS